ncbi:putative uroporphyrinogen III synthase [Prochlorococcus marinus str. NATL1A]|uniref:Uroporphyrinogen-III synthase n=1 Tax=Prochlorococcus marinus (strain NATL1A) TaxID=167555 RepID=A2BZU1_PROM1|nr:uroporphyrinogen-III synthase [Prochlorococcus marinus]ABM74751.1 putative uroporphyrinogen III synthase [Prochlorococcus marinus str. NATL1A]
MALTDKKIIITRALEQTSEAREIFRKNGAEVFDLPSLVIGPPDDWEPLDGALKEITTFDWIIFSSANGVRNVDERMKEIGLSLSEISENIQIAAVGRKTASLLEDMDVKVSFVPPSFVADSLVEYFPQNQKGLKLFIPRVQTGGRSILSDSFKLKGAEVTEVAAYESSCPKDIPQKTIDALNSGQIDIIAFTSSKTVKNTVSLFTKHFGENWLKLIQKIQLVSIGPQTTISCKNLIRKPDKEASPHDLEGLLQACLELNFN